MNAKHVILSLLFWLEWDDDEHYIMATVKLELGNLVKIQSTSRTRERESSTLVQVKVGLLGGAMPTNFNVTVDPISIQHCGGGVGFLYPTRG